MPRHLFKMHRVESSVFSHIGWFSVGLLVLRFRSGTVTCSQPVTRSMWRGLMRAKSKGRYWGRKIRPKVQAAVIEGATKDTIMTYIVASK